MQEPQANQPNVELLFRLFISLLDEASGLLKLYFTLSTGAVVLFTNLLVQIRAMRIAPIPLALSIFAFGAVAVFCLRLLMGMIRYRGILADSISTGAEPETVKKNMDAWGKRVNKHGKWLERLFWLGIAFAAIFVAAIALGRPM